MNWLARLKQQAHPVDTANTVNTGNAPQPDVTEPTKPGFVGFVAPILAPLQKTGGDLSAANDPAPVPVQVSTAVVSTLVTSQTHVFEFTDGNPDRWAWPHSDAMNSTEIDSFTARLVRFTDRGLDLARAETLADKLTIRDRDGDERRHCLECARLNASGQCGQRRAVLEVLQRCAVFKDARH